MPNLSKLLAAVGLLIVALFFAASNSQAHHNPNAEPQSVWQQGTVSSKPGTHRTYWNCDADGNDVPNPACATAVRNEVGTPERLSSYEDHLGKGLCETDWKANDDNAAEGDKLWSLPAGNCGHHGFLQGYYSGHADNPLPQLICENGTWQDGAWLRAGNPSRPMVRLTNAFGESVLLPPRFNVNVAGVTTTQNPTVEHNAVGTAAWPAVPGHACGEWVPDPNAASTTTTTTVPSGSCNHSPALLAAFGDKDFLMSIITPREVDVYEGDIVAVEWRLWRKTPQVQHPLGGIAHYYGWLGRDLTSTAYYPNYLLERGFDVGELTAEQAIHASPIAPTTDFRPHDGSRRIRNFIETADRWWVDKDGTPSTSGCLNRHQPFTRADIIENSQGDSGDETFYFHIDEPPNGSPWTIVYDRAKIVIKEGTAPPTTTTTTPPSTTVPPTTTTIPNDPCLIHDYYDAAGITSTQQARADDWQGPRPQRSEGCDTGEYEFEIPPIQTIVEPPIDGFGDVCVDYRAVSDGYIVSNLVFSNSLSDARELPVLSNDYVALLPGSTTTRVAVDLRIEREPYEGDAWLDGDRIAYLPHAWSSGQDELVYSIQAAGNPCRSVARVQLTFAAKPPTAAGYGIVRIPYTNNDQAETGETKGLRAAYYRPDGVKDPHTYQLRHEAVAHFNVWDKTT